MLKKLTRTISLLTAVITLCASAYKLYSVLEAKKEEKALEEA